MKTSPMTKNMAQPMKMIPAPTQPIKTTPDVPLNTLQKILHKLQTIESG